MTADAHERRQLAIVSRSRWLTFAIDSTAFAKPVVLYKPTDARSEAGDAALAVALGTDAPTYRVPAVNAHTSQRGGRRTVSGDPLTLEVYKKLSKAWFLHGFCFPRSRHKV